MKGNETYSEILALPDYEIAEIAARATSSQLLSAIAADGSEWVRLIVADNPNASPETLTKLSKDESNIVSKAADSAIVRRAAKVAADMTTSPDQLAALATHESGLVRIQVAYNPNTSLKTLESLAKDDDIGVRNLVNRAIISRGVNRSQESGNKMASSAADSAILSKSETSKSP
jgi:hypothetical protein